ncbi:MAG TPA: hypothetical protein VK870_01105 [Ignavibacteriaceae bacterium]|nr:hypothetical protein [Ignavibacteriaceae bacterium]
MKNRSFFTKLFASISLTAAAVWIGSYLVKIFIIYNLFEPVDLALKERYLQTDLNNLFFTLLPAFATAFIAYIIFIFTFITFLSLSKISLKQNGWLFISVLIVIITFPFELYLMLTDYKIISLLLLESLNSDTILHLIRDRITSLSSFPVIAILSYISILFLIIFKPLTNINKVT